MGAPSSNLRTILRSSVAELDSCVQGLTKHFPRPRLVRSKRGGFMARHARPDDLLASHLKCVRTAMALNSALLLLDAGQVQDAYTLCRVADEQSEDVLFMAGPLGENGKPSSDQIRFFNEFCQEELDDSKPLLDAAQERESRSEEENSGGACPHKHHGQSA